MANELVIPPDIKPESGETVELVDDQTVGFKPMFGRDWSQRNSFGDPRWRFSRKYRGLRMSDGARIKSTISEAQGGFRTIMVSPAQESRGTWATQAGGEVLTTSDLSSTTGWSSVSGNITVSDGVLRLTMPSATSGDVYQQPTVTQYAPYALRVLIAEGAQSSGLSIGPYLGGGAVDVAAVNSTRGYKVVAAVTLSTTMTAYALLWSSTSGYTAGAYASLLFASAARCMLADSPENLALRSDEFDNASWTKSNWTVTANALIGPDGTTTMDSLQENATPSVQHFVIQTVARTAVVEDLCGYVVAVRGSGTRNIQLYVDDGSSNGGSAIFDLGAGTVGTTATVGTGSNVRAFIRNLGSRYLCYVIVKVPATASARVAVYAHNGSSTTYTGDGTSIIYLWRGGLARSSVPCRTIQTTSAAVSATTQNGPNIFVKGLPASQSGLMCAGDWVEIDGQLKQLTANLNTDAAGTGHLQVRSKVVRSIADNTPVIVTKPMGRFTLADRISYQAQYGLYSEYDLTLDEVFE